MSGERPGIGPGEPVVLDAVIVIDHLNGVREATRFLAEVRERAAVSAITRAEVLCGFAPGKEAAPAALLNEFPLLPIDGQVADLGARLRRVHGWKLPDALQAGVARAHGLYLATRNTRDFDPERHDFVRVPYEIP